VALISGATPLVYDLMRGKDAISVHHNTYTQESPRAPIYDMHYALEFGVLLSGSMRRLYPDWDCVLGPGHVWFQGAWEPHGYELLTLPVTTLVFGLVPQAFMAGFAETPPDYDWMAPFVAPPRDRPQVPPGLRREVLNTASKVTGRLTLRKSPVRLWNTLLLFEMMLLARDDWQPPTRAFAPHPDAHTRINQAISMVLASSTAVSVAEAAKACDMSRNAFSRLFTSAMGLPFAKYCLRHRLSAGAEQLARTDHPIKSIAMEWGFADASHFSQCFHKHYGCSPAEYRRRQ
jgi:AraC-like DNA-binding protein